MYVEIEMWTWTNIELFVNNVEVVQAASRWTWTISLNEDEVC